MNNTPLPDYDAIEKHTACVTCGDCSNMEDCVGGTGTVCSYYGFAVRPNYQACVDCQGALPAEETSDEEESDEQLAARTVHNMNLISAFLDHVKEETGIEVPEKVVLDFFGA